MHRPMTLTEKILFAHAVAPPEHGLRAGDVVRIKVDWTLASELAWNGMEQTYAALGRPALHDASRFYLAIDHTVDATTLADDPRTQRLTALSRSFAREQGLKHFFDANETILHTRFYRDLVQPGQVVLGADSHTSSHGGVGAFAMGLGGADVTVAMVLGESWIQVPEAIAVEFTGALPFGLTGKDVVLATLGTFGRNTVAMERSVEYVGEGVSSLSVDARFTIANMTAEFGGLNGVFEADGVTAAWLSRRRAYTDDARAFRADPDATYATRHRVDLSTLTPLLAKPFSPDNVAPVSEHLGMPFDGAFIGACTTTEEALVLGGMVLAAMIKAGHRPIATTRRLVVPGDLSIMETLRETGLLSAYEAAGFRVGPPGCSMCLGVASERAAPGEVWLTSQNRNYHNRMGRGSEAWLGSAATVAASAMALKITDPSPWADRVDQDRFNRILGRDPGPLPEVRVAHPSPITPPVATRRTDTSEVKTAPQRVVGRVQRFGDHVDTDAIIPGEFCHLTRLDALGTHCFHHVAPGFSARVADGATVVVAGEAWGSGSSREHAVWALKGAGVQVVIARSYAFIHRRNLVNEALPHLVVHDDAFYALAVSDATLLVDLSANTVEVAGRVFAAEPAPPMVRALQRAGGIVPAINTYGHEVFERLTR